jgi:hypothetical protein
VPIPPSHRASARAAVVFALLFAGAGCSDDKKTAAKDAGPAPVLAPGAAKKPAPGKPAATLSPQ